jgi:hypothetical protein
VSSDAAFVVTASGRDRTPADARTGLTVREVARRYRVSPDKVRGWIKRGELTAINTAAALSHKPRWVITIDALTAFERRRTSAPPQPAPRRRRPAGQTDYYPD